MKNKKIDNWLYAFLGISVSLLIPMSEFFSDDGGVRILFGGFLGVIGAVIGLGLYSLFNNKPAIVKSIILVFLTLIIGSSIYFLNNYTSNLTCDICGYKSIEENQSECKNCGYDTWEIEKETGLFQSKKEWLKSEQLFLFSRDDNDTNKIDFYGPERENGFIKNSNWKPAISKLDYFQNKK